MKTSTNFKNILLVTALTGSFIGCGNKSSNPVSQYSVKSVPVGQGGVSGTQDVPSNPFQIEIVGSNQQNFASFVEGQKGTIQFQVRLLDDRITKWTLLPISLPKDATFTPSPGNPNIWILEWTPPRHTVQPNSNSAQVSIQVQAKIEDASEVRLKAISVPSQTHTISVRLTGEQPEIVGISKLGETAKNSRMILINEGEDKTFTVDVKDPGSYAGNPPRLDKKPCTTEGNAEDPETDGSIFVMPDPSNPGVKQLANGNWRFHKVFTTKKYPVIAPTDANGNFDTKAPHRNFCFHLEAQSPSGLRSGDELVSVRIQFKPETPRIVWGLQEAKFNSGETARLSFSVETKSKNGVLDINKPDFSNWPNSPALECKPDTSSGRENLYRQECDFIWDVPSDESLLNSTYTLKITATNTVVGLLPANQPASKVIRIIKKQPPVAPVKSVKTASAKPATPPAKPIAPVKPAAASTKPTSTSTPGATK
ncbi:MAG: hypothetical protein AB7F59_08645 [Bdellovibrionales bacterium]